MNNSILFQLHHAQRVMLGPNYTHGQALNAANSLQHCVLVICQSKNRCITFTSHCRLVLHYPRAPPS